ncbi:MAG: metallophosphoesterase [Planctomycetes bacterium]|nr:metallophosphoesterase [Planctomycetota bacterium]
MPVIAAPGNHDYYESPKAGKYNQPGSERAIRRYLTYFEYPSNGSGSGQEGRYYSLDYGPVTIVALDVANDSPHQSERDTNFFLLGEGDPNGGRAPAFGPGSRQYEWLRNALERAQSRSEFTFVIFHHVPYSVGPHGWPPGEGDGADTQSGVPVRSLTPLFLRYGVDAIIAGHDELWERSEIDGVEILPGGEERAHTLHVYDVGIAGDGLRGPEGGLTNPQQKFLVHTDAPEQWRNGVLVEGGKHYGHLEVDVYPLEDGGWQAELRPVHVFPLFESPSRYVRSERRLYDDVQILTRRQ